MATRKKAGNPERKPASEHSSAGRLLIDSGKQEIIVRMYRQGLGDCFLLALPTKKPNDSRYVLVDCGVHMREDNGTARLKQVMDNLAAATGSHVHVVVATHEHADHLSGFVQKDSPFLKDEFKVDELWVAWTEKRGDNQADELRKKHGTAQRLIDKAVKEARRVSGNNAFAGQKRADYIAELNDFERPAENSFDEARLLELMETMKKQSATNSGGPDRALYENTVLGAAKAKKAEKEKPSANELALGLLGFKAGKNNTTYCEPAQVLTVSDVPDFRAYALGPPRDPDLLEQDKPTKIRGAKEGDEDGMYKEVYLGRRGGNRAFALSPQLNLEAYTPEGSTLPDAWRYPFPPSYRRCFEMKAQPGAGPGFQWSKVSRGTAVPAETKKIVDEFYLRPSSSWRRIDGDWLGTAEDLALNLDSDTNNTGLVLAFEWGPPGKGAVLLFPGDAQVGNWLSWYRQDYRAGDEKISADDLLSRTLLYKVGHHGSHNATIRRDPSRASSDSPLGAPCGLELMDDIVAMIPVDGVAVRKKMPNPWRMPHEPLYRRLREKARGRILRSDAELSPLKPGVDQADTYPESETWEPVPGLKNVRWRRSKEEFLEGTKGPLYYDVAIEVMDPRG